MKTKHLIIAAIFGLGAFGAVFATETTGVKQKVQVKFVDPDKFSDIRDANMPSEKGQAAYLDIIRKHLEESAGKYLTDGQKLDVTVTNIDMAGDFEPWGGMQTQDIRIIKDIYPPRVDLSFKLTDADGKVIKEGSRELRDLNFMMNISLNRDEELHYVKELLNDWIRKDLRSAK